MRAPHRRHRRALWAALATGAVALAIIAVLARAPLASQVDANSPLVGKAAPPIVGTTLSGQRFSLTALRGHFVVVDFFASWCVPCRSEQPQLDQFVAEHSGTHGARLVGVIFNDSVANVRGWLGPVTSLYPMIPDSSAEIAINYGVANPPSKYLIDPAGRIFGKVIGPVTAAELDSLLARGPKNDRLPSSSSNVAPNDSRISP